MIILLVAQPSSPAKKRMYSWLSGIVSMMIVINEVAVAGCAI